MKRLVFFLVALLPLTAAMAQNTCSGHTIYGTWKLCGSMRSDSYEQPPANINADSLKIALGEYDTSGATWRFTEDGTYEQTNGRSYQKGGKGRFWVVENNCALKLSTRKRNPMRIVYLDDSYMILWYNDPHTAHLTVYRRLQ